MAHTEAILPEKFGVWMSCLCHMHACKEKITLKQISVTVYKSCGKYSRQAKSIELLVY
jgi:hypothetical protein